MSFRATLTIEGKSYNVLQCAHSLKQKSERGKVTSGVRGGSIVLIIDSTDEEIFGSWATSPTAKKNGELVFDRIDQQSSLQKLEFEDAYAIFFFEFMASEYMNNVDPIIDTMRDIFDLDESGKQDLLDRYITGTNVILNFAKRTGISNCILLRLSAAKIKLDGIDHQNT
ncbi:type VI secretion system tube protein TssD [Spirosoma litoris]